MSYSFNLVDQPWIPCIGRDSRSSELSMRQALVQARHMRGIACSSPLETAALYRLLLAVLHSAIRGPVDDLEWNKLWQEKTWDTLWLHEYLDRWKHRFDLFDPDRPFYQARDERVKPKTALQLFHGMGTANELFEHVSVTENVQYNCSVAARALLVGQLFGLGGGCDPKQNLYLSFGPWAKGVIFLVEGNDLFETLALNLLEYSRNSPIPRIGDDLPAWEMDDPFRTDCQRPQGYLDYLTLQNRRFLLIPEDGPDGIMVSRMTIAPGLPPGKEIYDPMKQYSVTQKGWRLWEFSEGRSLWRDSDALFRLKKPDNYRAPKSCEWLSTLVEFGYIDVKKTFRFMALGMGSVPGKAKIEFYRQEHLPLPLAYLEGARGDELVGMLSESLSLAESVRRNLWIAINTLARLILSPSADQSNGRQPDPKDVNNLTSHWAVERFYWGRLELPFLHLLEDLPEQPQKAMAAWKEALRQIAWRALERAADLAGESPGALKAAVRARAVLGQALKRLFPNYNEQKVTA